MSESPSNYICSENPFDLLGPPQWWLDKLKEFDDSLVVIPSKQGYFYRLCQRRPPDPRVTLAHSLSNDSDSKTMARLSLVPVTTIMANALWDNPVMWEDLRMRAPHRMGGAEKFEQLILAKEAKQQLDIAKQNDEILTDRARDAWGYYLMKAGRRQTMYVPKTAVSPTARHTQASAAIRILGPDGKVVSSK
jgi:hypothetical protein